MTQPEFVNDTQFYLWAWDNKPHICEECGLFLPRFSRSFVSHIWSKGANDFYRWDIRNFNILCLTHHNEWEYGARSKMKINPGNQIIIQELKLEYYAKV